MFETFEFETLTPQLASVFYAGVLGLIFGAIAQHIQFCFRRGLVGAPHERRSARAIWFTALAVAILGTQFGVYQGWIGFEEHRFFAADMPIVAIAIGGVLFGAGMVLTRGCVSRLSVLVGTGNMRALLVLIIFAITAHATLKGVLAPLRTTLGALTVNFGDSVSAASLPGGGLVWGGIFALLALSQALKSGAKPSHLGLAIILGALVPLGWIGTGFILFDEFDPIALQSLSFTSPATDVLFWTIASTAIPAGFGVGMFGGVIAGSFLITVVKSGFRSQSFETPAQTGRYLLGVVLMGLGGVLAGGCTVGAGLSGIPTLAFSAIIALGFIALGALITARLVDKDVATSSMVAAQ